MDTKVYLTNYTEEFYSNPGQIDISELDLKNTDSSIYETLWGNKSVISNGGIDLTPVCSCGKSVGHMYENRECPICRTIVEIPILSEKNIRTNYWVSYPLDEETKFLHPIIYEILVKATAIRSNKIKEKSLIDVVLNMYAQIPPNINEEEIPARGFHEVEKNFLIVLDFLKKQVKTERSKTIIDDVVELYNRHSECFFTRYLPILNNAIHSISKDENGGSLSYVDAESTLAVKAVLSISSLRTKPIKASSHKTLFDSYQAISEYYNNIIKTGIGKKEGLARQELFGRRTHFTSRHVIVSSSFKHRYDSIVMPWYSLVKTFQLTIVHRLSNLYNDAIKANEVWQYATLNYHKDVEDIIVDIIRGAGYQHPEKGWIQFPGYPVVLNRNPSINKGSLELLFATENFSRCPKSASMSISVINLKLFNADFDGDELNVWYIHEMEYAHKLISTHPSFNLMNLNEPGIGKNITTGNQVTACVNSFLRSRKKEREKQL